MGHELGSILVSCLAPLIEEGIFAEVAQAGIGNSAEHYSEAKIATSQTPAGVPRCTPRFWV